jgi:hypothetical protein
MAGRLHARDASVMLLTSVPETHILNVLVLCDEEESLVIDTTSAC